MEKVSICIPVYNGEKTIAATIESAIKQSYPNIEILIIDNNSNDNTVDIIEGIKDSRIVFFRNPVNLGMVGNWNECIKKSTGEYIHFLCADDYIDPQCIEKKVAAMKKNREIVLVTSARSVVDEHDRIIYKRKIYKKNMIVDGSKFAKKSLRTGNIYGEPSNVLFKKNVIEKVGMFSANLRYTTDWELWIRISTLGKIAYINKDLSRYRISTSNITSSMKIREIMEDDKTMMKNLLKGRFLNIGYKDVVLHRFVITFRDILRILFITTLETSTILKR